MFTDGNISAHYIKHWHINHSWHCWESVETKDSKGAFLCSLNDVLGSWNNEKMLKASTIDDAFWRYKKRLFSELGTSGNTLKLRTINCAFWCYLKRCSCSWNCWEKNKSTDANGAFWRYLQRHFGSWNCWEHFETNEAKLYILMLFETMFLKLNCIEHFECKKAK